MSQSIVSPILQEQRRLEKRRQICEEILRDARNELYLKMRFLDVALAGLRFAEERSIEFLGTDGEQLFYEPEALMRAYQKSKVLVNRAYLHSLFHCLFCHQLAVTTDPYEQERTRAIREAGIQAWDREYWNLACDLAVELLIEELSVACLHQPASRERRQVIRWLKEEGGILTAQKIYRRLCQLHLPEPKLAVLKREFQVDDHRYWSREEPQAPSMRQQRDHWEEIREKMQTEMETFSKEASHDCETLTDTLRAENRRRYDYKTFLRKFMVLREEMQIDPEAFDPVFYHYGMRVYGNMPLIEPLETREVKRIQDFVIVIDTSMSCKGELVQKFLEETYSVLSEEESFFHKIHVHILQCDEKVQADTVITSREELQSYMEHITLAGLGGTDFRPPFAYVEELRARGEFSHLRGLLYFTDGYGLFPVQKPDYETAFIFMKEDYQDVDVPPWAIQLLLEPEDLQNEH